MLQEKKPAQKRLLKSLVVLKREGKNSKGVVTLRGTVSVSSASTNLSHLFFYLHVYVNWSPYFYNFYVELVYFIGVYVRGKVQNFHKMSKVGIINIY